MPGEHVKGCFEKYVCGVFFNGPRAPIGEQTCLEHPVLLGNTSGRFAEPVELGLLPFGKTKDGHELAFELTLALSHRGVHE